MLRLNLSLAVCLSILTPVAAQAADPILGYINHLPAESPAARAARHERIARKLATGGPFIILHRGARDFAPENTLEAYKASMEYGADGNEFDPRVTKDGVFYTFHDDTADRMLQGTGRMKDKTYHEILNMPFDRIYGRATSRTRVPTLQSFFILARENDWLLHFDIKESGIQDTMILWLDQLDMWDHVVHINGGNADKMTRHPKYRHLDFKGWFPVNQANDPVAVANFLATPGDLIMMDDDPTPAVRAMNRPVPGLSPWPVDLRAWWWLNGLVDPVRARWVVK